MQEFFTRQIANEGIRLPLVLPDGSPSEHWLQVRGMDSDEFHTAEMIAKREAAMIADIPSDEERAVAVNDAQNTLIAALIADWSFPTDCTKENVKNFLREAPQIADEVNRLAAKRSLFFKKKQVPSTTGSKKK